MWTNASNDLLMAQNLLGGVFAPLYSPILAVRTTSRVGSLPFVAAGLRVVNHLAREPPPKVDRPRAGLIDSKLGHSAPGKLRLNDPIPDRCAPWFLALPDKRSLRTSLDSFCSHPIFRLLHDLATTTR